MGTAYTQGENPSLLGALKLANFNTTADQPIVISAAKYIVRRIVIANATANLGVAVGGFYTGASKSGSAIVANTQVYTALTTSAKFLDVTLAAVATTDVFTANPIYFALTVALGLEGLGDIYIIGDVIF